MAGQAARRISLKAEIVTNQYFILIICIEIIILSAGIKIEDKPVIKFSADTLVAHRPAQINAFDKTAFFEDIDMGRKRCEY